MAGLYLHIPFCKTKCIYCDFYSITDLSKRSLFIQRLLQELHQRSGELPEDDSIVETIYFGGGTPSLLTVDELTLVFDAIRDCYQISNDVEITIECNPGDVSLVSASALMALGINRFSIGSQSFDCNTLHTLTRRHTPQETRQLVAQLREVGAGNISLDLIYAVPGTTPEDLYWDLDALMALTPEHISAYSLMYEEGTPLYGGLLAHKVQEVDEDIALEMSRLVRHYLTLNGYEQYEISNFRKVVPGIDYRSRHNSAYWSGRPYLGFGPSAHSYVHPVRSWNPASLEDYLLGQKREEELLTQEMQLDEYLLTRLRTANGISSKEILRLSKTSNRGHEILKRADWLTTCQIPLLRRKGDLYQLTDQGIDLSDAVLRQLV